MLFIQPWYVQMLYTRSAIIPLTANSSSAGNGGTGVITGGNKSIWTADEREFDAYYQREMERATGRQSIGEPQNSQPGAVPTMAPLSQPGSGSLGTMQMNEVRHDISGRAPGSQSVHPREPAKAHFGA